MLAASAGGRIFTSAVEREDTVTAMPQDERMDFLMMVAIGKEDGKSGMIDGMKRIEFFFKKVGRFVVKCGEKQATSSELWEQKRSLLCAAHPAAVKWNLQRYPSSYSSHFITSNTSGNTSLLYFSASTCSPISR